MALEYIDFNIQYLDQLIELWNETLIHDLINEHTFLQRIAYDPNFDASLSKLAIDNEKVVGYCHGVKRKESYYTKGLEPDRGWINFIFVDKNYRRKGIGTHLYEQVKDELLLQGATSITLCAYSPNYLNPGIDVRYKEGLQFFEAMGYSISENNSVSMQRSLWDFELTSDFYDKVDSLSKDSIVIRNYKVQDFNRVIDFLNKEFEHGWVRNFIIASQSERAERTIVICLNENQEVLGFCMRQIDGNPNRFGPIGVGSKIRSKGLGGVLIDTMFYEMKKEGLLYTNFLWTSGDAIRFYERHGMSIYREYKTAKKVYKL